MNAADVMVVLKMLQAALPGTRLDERTPDVWANACATVDPDEGLAAAKRMLVTLSAKDRFPAPADFLRYVSLVKAERAPLGLPESTDTPLTADAAKVWIAKAKDAAETARKLSPYTRKP